MTLTEVAVSTPIDYTPTVMTVLATLLAAAFTSVISQYFFAPWLEVRKEIKIELARERKKLSNEALDYARALMKLRNAKRAWKNSGHLDGQWETSMAEYRKRLPAPGAAFTGYHGPIPKKVWDLIVATEFALQVVHIRKTLEKAPVEEVTTIALHHSSAVDPVKFPPVRVIHTWFGLRRSSKLLKSIKDIPFGE